MAQHRQNGLSDPGTDLLRVVEHLLVVGQVGDLLAAPCTVQHIAEVHVGLGSLGERLEILGVCHEDIFDTEIVQHRLKLLLDIAFLFSSRGLLLARSLMQVDDNDIILGEIKRSDILLNNLVFSDLINQNRNAIFGLFIIREKQILH